MKKATVRQIIVCLVLAMLVSPLWSAVPASAAGYPLSTGDPRITAALDFLRNSEASHPALWAGGEKTCYAIVAIDACGGNPHSFENSSGKSMVEIIEDDVDKYLKPQPSASLPHEFYLLAIVAAGEDPWDFGGVNVAGQLLDMFNGTQIGQTGIVNDDFWAIIALTGAGVDPSLPAIQTIKDFIIDHQNGDGGWGSSISGGGMGAGSDPCDTANAVMALVAAGQDPSSSVIQQAFAYLHTMQNDDGGFPYVETVSASDVASDARVMAAIRACGGSPTAAGWTVNGNNPFDHALSLQQDDGGFAWTAGGSTDGWMTTYIMPALVGKYWPTRTTRSDRGDPVVGSVVPEEDGAIESLRPEIGASFSDSVSGIDVDSVSLELGSDDVTEEADISQSGISYTPATDLSEGSHTVRLEVADRAGNDTVYTWSFTIGSGTPEDTTPPEISELVPADGETVATPRPEIVVTYTDDASGIDTGSVILTVDGTDVTTLCDVETDRLSYLPGEDLTEGSITARIVVRDTAGNHIYRTWEFGITGSDDAGSAAAAESSPTAGEDSGAAQRASLDLAGRIAGDGVITTRSTLVSADGRLTLVLDAGVVATGGDGTPLDAVTVEPCATAPAMPGNLLPVGMTYRLGPDNAVLTPSIGIELGYDELEATPELTAWDVNCDGTVDASDIIQVQTSEWSGKTAEGFIIAGYDADSGKWLSLDSSLDLAERSLAAEAGYMPYLTVACPRSSTGTQETTTDTSVSLAGKTDGSGLLVSDVVVQSSDRAKRLEIPQGTTVSNLHGTPAETITVSVQDTAPATADGYCRIGTACRFGPRGTTFDPPVVLTFVYEESSSQESIRWDANGDGTVDFLDKDTVVAPEDFRIAYYDAATAAWVALESTVDRVANTVTAEVDHFTLFALTAPTTGSLITTDVDIEPGTVDLGESVTLTVTVENPGEHRGTYMIPVEIDGYLETSQEVTLAPGEHEITFDHREPYAGTHRVTVLGETAEFTVRETAASHGRWWDSVDVVFYLYVGIGVLCVLIIAGIIILARVWRRNTSQ
jgi:hypothetical protein